MMARLLMSTANGQVQSKAELDRAKERLDRIIADAQTVIRILTAEQALKAQRVVREAGRDRR